MNVAYRSADADTLSRVPDAADVASAVQKALVEADFNVGDRAEPVKSVAGVDKQVEVAGNGTAGRRLSESGPSGTFTITVVAKATELPAISKQVRKLDFGKDVEDALVAAGHTGIARTVGSYSPISVLPGDVMGPLTLEDKPPPETLGGGLNFQDPGEANQSVAEDGFPGWGAAVIVVLLLCCMLPFFCYLYAHFKYGAGKERTWFSWRFTHSNPTLPFLYVPYEDREARWATLYAEKKPMATLDESTAEESI